MKNIVFIQSDYRAAQILYTYIWVYMYIYPTYKESINLKRILMCIMETINELMQMTYLLIKDEYGSM
jgi:hypothetical protein